MANLLLNRAKKAKHDPAVSTLLPSVVSLYFYLSQLDLCLEGFFSLLYLNMKPSPGVLAIQIQIQAV